MAPPTSEEARDAGIDLPRDAGHRAAWLAATVEHPLTRPDHHVGEPVCVMRGAATPA